MKEIQRGGLLDSLMADLRKAHEENRNAWKNMRPIEGNHRQRYRRARKEEYLREFKQADWQKLNKRNYWLE